MRRATPDDEYESSTLNDAYRDRNQAVLVLARLAIAKGMNAGIKYNPDDPDWPVLLVDLPSGQVSWHIPKDELEGDWPVYMGGWDGHTLEEKRDRMSHVIRLTKKP